jgi:hypothetical protein
MYSHCPHCGLKYEIEPAFFMGAMYVSYGFSVAIAIGCAMILSVLVEDASFWLYGITLFTAVLIVVPLNFRFSRILWLYMFVQFKTPE